MPLLREGRPFGTITVFSKVFKPFAAADARMSTLFASQIEFLHDRASTVLLTDT